MIWFKRLFIYLSTFLVSVMLAFSALAADPLPAHVVGGTLDVVGPFLQQIVFPVVSALFLALLSIFLNRIGQKYKIEALTKQNSAIEQLAYQGITKAEELAAKYVGSKMQFTGDDKLSVAVSHILQFMPTVTEDQAKSMVHSLLAQIPGLGASGDTAVERFPTPTAGILGATAILSNTDVPALTAAAAA